MASKNGINKKAKDNDQKRRNGSRAMSVSIVILFKNNAIMIKSFRHS